jgi:hypothetical protein
MYRASTHHLGMTIYAKERKKLHATNCQTDGIWFGNGEESRMGRQIVQDLGISIEVMHELQDLLGADWRVSNTTKESRKVCEATFIFIGVFCWALSWWHWERHDRFGSIVGIIQRTASCWHW